MTEAVIGLGTLVARELLGALSLSPEDDASVGPEFTYLGLFLSGLCSASEDSPGGDVAQLCLASLKAIHASLGAHDQTLADTLAASAFREYINALPSWPSNAAFMNAGILLCAVLVTRLKAQHAVVLDVLKQARLRALISQQMEILEIAFAEMRGANMREHPSHDDKVSYPMRTTAPPSLDALRASKAKLLGDWDDGEITGKEFMEALDGLTAQEIALRVADIQREPDLDTLYKSPRVRRIAFFVIATSLLLGFFISPWIYPKLFGYKNAEECAIATKSKYAIGACYDLYPRAKQ